MTNRSRGLPIGNQSDPTELLCIASMDVEAVGRPDADAETRISPGPEFARKRIEAMPASAIAGLSPINSAGPSTAKETARESAGIAVPFASSMIA